MNCKLVIAALALLMTSGTARASVREDECRKNMTEYYDILIPDCAARKLSSRPMGPACPFAWRPFEPTKTIPDMAAYRQLWIEFKIQDCMMTPHATDKN
jgi:hypothetical protein